MICAILCVGGVFIVWDVMFRTFAREGDKIIYGLVHPVNTFNPIKLQVRCVALGGCGLVDNLQFLYLCNSPS